MIVRVKNRKKNLKFNPLLKLGKAKYFAFSSSSYTFLSFIINARKLTRVSQENLEVSISTTVAIESKNTAFVVSSIVTDCFS